MWAAARKSQTVRAQEGRIAMRILHISPIDVVGGAARGAYGLHKALQANGLDSKMLVLRKYSDDPSVVTPAGRHGPNILLQAMRDRMDRLPLRFYGWDPANWWTVGWLPFNIVRDIEALAPDVVHLHWAGRGAAPIAMLRRLSHYPLVWTLRDMWPITGGCHYAGDCERFKTGCGHCPQLRSTTALDISAWQWRRKRRAWRDVKVSYVAPSRWMAAFAEASPLIGKNKVHTIPNGVDVSRFKKTDRTAACDAWDLPQDKQIIMFGAINSTGDPRKGYSYLVEAVRQLAARGWSEKVAVVVFGATEAPDVDLGCESRYIGTLRDDISLALLYSCADVMVVPSVQENAGKTAIEAMACGVPVVAFANTGQIEIVDHKLNGYLAENLSSSDLAEGIEWCLTRSGADALLRHRARAKATERFDIRAVAGQYSSLYESLVAGPSELLGETGEMPVAAPHAFPVPASRDRLSASTGTGGR
jgi:glycosyltransferase involved in cell wall biosynthesis